MTKKTNRKIQPKRVPPPQGEAPRTWYGTTIQPYGFQHFDARVNGASLVLTITPADSEDGELSWMLRMTGERPQMWAQAWQDGELTGLEGQDGTAVIFDPGLDDGLGGRLAVYADAGSDNQRMVRWSDQPLPVWNMMGREIAKLLPQREPGPDGDDWTMEDMRPCSACGRPVFESMDMVVIPAMPPLMVCAQCASGETERMIDLHPEGRRVIPQRQQQALRKVAEATGR